MGLKDNIKKIDDYSCERRINLWEMIVITAVISGVSSFGTYVLGLNHLERDLKKYYPLQMKEQLLNEQLEKRQEDESESEEIFFPEDYILPAQHEYFQDGGISFYNFGIYKNRIINI